MLSASTLACRTACCADGDVNAPGSVRSGIARAVAGHPRVVVALDAQLGRADEPAAVVELEPAVLRRAGWA